MSMFDVSQDWLRANTPRRCHYCRGEGYREAIMCDQPKVRCDACAGSGAAQEKEAA